ncbi:MAG: universal stress protein [Desulfatiglans sp.]|jgi:nucleotide-binding universal stress UspA family protein|nr:universal stress protein [Desulfatiglans sp.]
MAEKKEKILLALDASDYSFEIAKYISEIPYFKKNDVVLFSVFHKVPESYYDLENDPLYGKRIRNIEAWELQNRTSLEEYMKRAEKILLDSGFPRDNVIVKIHERKIGIARDILKEAKAGYSAVAVGRKGMSKVAGIVLGSVATKLLEQLIFVPLIVVGKDTGPGKILIAIDGSEGATRAVDYVASTLGGSAFEVKLVHVIRSGAEDYMKDARKEIEHVFDRTKNRLKKSGFQSNQIKSKIITGVRSRAEAIVEEARSGNYGTIVVGRRGLSKVREFFMGRISNKIIQLAKENVVWIVN